MSKDEGKVGLLAERLYLADAHWRGMRAIPFEEASGSDRAYWFYIVGLILEEGL